MEINFDMFGKDNKGEFIIAGPINAIDVSLYSGLSGKDYKLIISLDKETYDDLKSINIIKEKT